MSSIAYVTVLNSGTLYSTSTTVLFNKPAGGTRATGFPFISIHGNISSISVTNTGSGYTSTGTSTASITLLNVGSGTGATFHITLD